MWARGYWVSLATTPRTAKFEQDSTSILTHCGVHFRERGLWGERGLWRERRLWNDNVKKRLNPFKAKLDSGKAISRDFSWGLKSLFSLDDALRQLISQRVKLRGGRFLFYRRPFPPWVSYMLKKRPFGGDELATDVKGVNDLGTNTANTDYLEDEVEYPMTEDNNVRFYDDGETCMESMLRSIHQSTRRIWMESYCIDESAIGRIFVNELTKAAARGVDVVVSVDGAGSLGVPEQLRLDLREKGGRLVIFNPLWRTIGPLVYRNHRKVLICDDHAYCGSMNIDWRASGNLKTPDLVSRQTQLLGLSVKRPFWSVNNLINMIFRDQSHTRPGDYNHHFLVEGPIVNHLAESFCHILKKSRLPLTRENSPSHENRNSRLQSHQAISNVAIKLVQADGYHDGISNYAHAITSLLSRATSSVVIATSYFHPPGKIRQCIAKTLRSGVSSMLILSGMSDVPFDSQATLAILPYFLMGKNNFCRCFFTKKQHCHAKTITVDGTVSLSGSFNLDRYSVRRNCEVGLVFASKRLTQHINSRLHALVCDPSDTVAEYTLEDARNIATGWSFLDGFQQNRDAINVNISHESLD